MTRIKVTGPVTYGSAGSDQITGRSVSDTIYGGRSAVDPDDLGDTIWGGGGADLIYGNGGDDVLYGGSGTLNAADGNDTIHGGVGNDIIYGELGNDQLFGESGSDTIYGGAGSDVIYGGAGANDPADAADKIYGGEGNDTIYGNGGDDLIDGQMGVDILYGGGGRDTFVFKESWAVLQVNGIKAPLAYYRDSPTKSPDKVYGFEAADFIDFTKIDANTKDWALFAGDDYDKLYYTGNTAGSNYVWWEISGGNTLVHAGYDNTVLLVEYTGGLTADNFVI